MPGVAEGLRHMTSRRMSEGSTSALEKARVHHTIDGAVCFGDWLSPAFLLNHVIAGRNR